MYADPSSHPGETYRQEYSAGHAEDMADLLAIDASLWIPAGAFVGAVKTRDFTPLEPGQVEEKYYARGMDLIKALNPTTGEEEVLISHAAL